MLYPWLIAQVPPMPEDWTQAFEEAMAELARLHLPPKFRVTAVFEALGTLRFEWKNAGEAETDIKRIALRLAARTDSWGIDPTDVSF
ncbi:hypothetical protein [Magnetospirillum sp. UT-4]|uniref:hypothetical protein n=1 Tax=Magnetospirillum sp. UT-4 TaxID=2681467 RepID=UPI001380C80D|nr:hypothetical protein [Magnetospirillum sp. UT-4]CAA7616397.1 hypothetical protein MTBUT4_220047 [Magnetospirillum sp. UT-4]